MPKYIGLYLWSLPFNRLGRCSSAEIQWFRLWREFRIHKQSLILLALCFELAETLIFIIIQLDHVFFGKNLSVSHVILSCVSLFGSSRSLVIIRAEIDWNAHLEILQRDWLTLSRNANDYRKSSRFAVCVDSGNVHGNRVLECDRHLWKFDFTRSLKISVVKYQYAR